MRATVSEVTGMCVYPTLFRAHAVLCGRQPQAPFTPRKTKSLGNARANHPSSGAKDCDFCRQKSFFATKREDIWTFEAATEMWRRLRQNVGGVSDADFASPSNSVLKRPIGVGDPSHKEISVCIKTAG
jgi:hypothetical protein